jgi:hypothetical protein
MGWTFLTCVHGVTEGLDSHECPACNRIALRCGFDFSDDQTYIFTSEAQITRSIMEFANNNPAILSFCVEVLKKKFSDLIPECQSLFLDFFFDLKNIGGLQVVKQKYSMNTLRSMWEDFLILD